MIEKSSSPHKNPRKASLTRKTDGFGKKDKEVTDLKENLKELYAEYQKVCKLNQEKSEYLEKFKLDHQKSMAGLNDKYLSKCKDLDEIQKEIESINEINYRSHDGLVRTKKNYSKAADFFEEAEKYNQIINEKQQEIDSLVKKISSLNRERELILRESKIFKDSHKTDLEKISDIQKTLQDQSQIIQDLIRQLDTEKSQQSSNKLEIEALEREAETKRKALKELERREEELYHKYSDEKEKNLNLLHDVDSYTDEISLLKQALQHRDLKLSQLKQKNQIRNRHEKHI